MLRKLFLVRGVYSVVFNMTKGGGVHVMKLFKFPNIGMTQYLNTLKRKEKVKPELLKRVITIKM